MIVPKPSFFNNLKRAVRNLGPWAIVGLVPLSLIVILSVLTSLQGDDIEYADPLMTITYFLLAISVIGQLIFFFRRPRGQENKI